MGKSSRNGGASSGSATATHPTGSATALVDEWAEYVRSGGVPNQSGPSGAINITILQGNRQSASGQVHAGLGQCNQYLDAAQSALRSAYPVPPPPDQAGLIRYVNYLWANGVPNYPHPTGDKVDFYGTRVDPNIPFVQNASKACGTKLGYRAWRYNAGGRRGDILVTSSGLDPDGGLPASGVTPGGSQSLIPTDNDGSCPPPASEPANG